MVKKYKVDSAVILAAGRGRRLNKVTKIPKSLLLNKKGIPLIEDIIQKLHDKKIYKIIIVTGYKSRYFKYLIKKYDIKIIKNPEWRHSNNVSSLNMAFPFMNNSLVINGDIIMKKNIIENSFFSSITYAEKNKNLNEWIIELDKNNQIINFDKDGHNKEGYYQKEISFISSELLHYIKDEILEFDFNEYYEYLLLYSAKKHNIEFCIHKIPQNLINDVDTSIEFNKYIRNN